MDISQITDQLYIGTQPGAADHARLCQLGIRLVISMRGERRPPAELERPPLRVLWLRTYDSFFTPIPLEKLEQGVHAALPVMAAGGKVLVHCQEGRHRSVALGAAILIAQGHSADAAMKLLRARRRRARPQTWYIQSRIRAFEKRWQAR